MKSIRSNLVLVFDTETTGVDVNEDRIVQLGAAYYQDGGRLGPPRSMLVNPGMPIPSGASKVHGILDEHVANEPSWQVVGDRFAHHLANGPQGGAAPLLCGYNAVSYDTPSSMLNSIAMGNPRELIPNRSSTPSFLSAGTIAIGQSAVLNTSRLEKACD